MTALGRILQVVGWLWLVVGFFGPMFGLLSLNLLPGIALVFVARVIRNQAAQTDMPELGEPASNQQPETPARQPAATQRETREERPRRAPPEPYVVVAPSEPHSPAERERPTSQEMLERAVGVRDDPPSWEEISAMPEVTTPEESTKPMSSAEMIAMPEETAREESTKPMSSAEMIAMPDVTAREESTKPMSSAEMIARAHERWDSKPR